MKKVKLNDLHDAFMMTDTLQGDGTIFLCRKTGQFIIDSAVIGKPDSELDIDWTTCIGIPDRCELELGMMTALKFTRQFNPEDFTLVQIMFNSKGAFQRFNKHVEEKKLLGKWHVFQYEQEIEALRRWCAEEDIELEEPQKLSILDLTDSESLNNVFAGQLTELLKPLPETIAAWLGGSAATGFVDAFSDLDYLTVCEDDAVEMLIKKVDDFFDEHFGIERRYRVVEPAWHGFSQIFYKLSNTPDHYYLDISFLKRSLKDKFTDSSRHGNAVIQYQKETILDVTPESPDTTEKRAIKLFRRTIQTDFIDIAEVKKAIARNSYSSAFTSYYRFISRDLAVMLNLKYRPAKVDFGLRYSDRDYPGNTAQWLESLLKVTSVSEIKERFDSAITRYHQLVRELSIHYQK